MEGFNGAFDDRKRSEMTMKTYAQDIKALSKYFKNVTDLVDVEKVMSTLKKNYGSKHTIKNKLAVISLIIKGLNEFPNKEEVRSKYIREIKILDFDIAKENAKHVKTDKQKENWITKEDWQNMLKHYDVSDDKDLNKLRDYIVLAIYSQVALRNDLVDMIILPNFKYDEMKEKGIVPDTNILLFDNDESKCKLILKKYKTAKVYGENHIELEDIKDLDVYVGLYYYAKEEKRNSEVYLLSKLNGEPISGQAFCKYFKDLGKCINKDLSTTTIRHCAVSEIYDIMKLKKVAKRMGHSVHEALSVYAKI